MNFDTTGYVLKSARSAPSNNTTTAGADSGVLREHTDYVGTLPGDFVEVAADQYRAAVLDNPVSQTQEYLFWTANSSNLAVLEDPAWVTDQGTGTIPTGDIVFSGYTDGTPRIIVVDTDNRSIGQVLSVLVVRGDTKEEFTFRTSHFTQNPSGVVTLGSTALSLLGGALSVTRGDSVVEVRYYLAAQKFWWTRNDVYLQRFGWDGLTQRWAPYKGTAALSLGALLPDTTAQLNPRPTRFAIGDMLPGDSNAPDTYALIRIGVNADADATPASVLVVSDEDAAATYVFPSGLDGVLGVTSGVLQWNPDSVNTYAGQTAWYAPETFTQDSDGVLGDLRSSFLSIAPIPGPTEYPLIRIGSRSYLEAVSVENDAALASLSVATGQVGWSQTTGTLKFSLLDINKADPDSGQFELLYLGAKVVFDGVSLTSVPVGTRQPVQLVDSTGTPTVVGFDTDLYVPASQPMPAPGISGVMWLPDGTGVVPNNSLPPSTRPNGSGLIREVETAGDLILFGQIGSLESISVVEYESDLPKFPFKIPKGKAVLARELGAGGSKLMLGRRDRQRFAGEPLYFLQALVQPAVAISQARFVSRVQEPFTLVGDEVLAFAVDGQAYLWDASSLGAGTFDAATVAASVNATITGTGQCQAVRGHLWLEAGNLDTGSVEIGFGSDVSGSFADRNLSGCAVLGFLPGWSVSNPVASPAWLPDSGMALGVRRSPQNLDRSKPIADFKATYRFSNTVLSKGVIASPVFPISNPPLLDVAGYDEGVFFQIQDGLYRKSLQPFVDAYYEFESDRFSWAEPNTILTGISERTFSFDLGGFSIIPETLHPSVGDGYGLYVDPDGTGFDILALGSEYLLEAQPGLATLIRQESMIVDHGSQGSFTAGSVVFEDPDARFFSTLNPGYQLEILSGDSKGTYVIESVVSNTELHVSSAVPFLSTGGHVAWKASSGVESDYYDDNIIADVLYEDFNHLPQEPFQIRVWSSLGTTPSSSITRLTAFVSDLGSRIATVHFMNNLSEPEAHVTALTIATLGVVANDIHIPDLLDPHFILGKFKIQIGARTYTQGVDLHAVTAFTPNLSGDQIEYGESGSGIEGLLHFGSDTLTQMDQSIVSYTQVFLDSDDLSAGQAEVDLVTGELNLSTADMTYYTGLPAYFVEQMITERQTDVVMSPLIGSLLFKTPLRPFQRVEARYYQADSSGNQIRVNGMATQIVEFLPLYVRQEVATRVLDTVYMFNPSNRLVADVPTQVWVDNRLQNYGNTITAVVDTQTSTIQFTTPIAANATVLINYAVTETFGGEQGFSVSTTPVYRPPFFLQAGEDTFTLETDRSGDLLPGKMLRLGANPFYIKASTYDAPTDTTTVTIYPTPLVEAGSRAPGNDVLALITSVPVVDGVDGVDTTAAPGYMLTLATTHDPVSKGMLSIAIQGNLVSFAVAGHLLDIDGYPLLIVGANLTSDGLSTVVDFSTPLPTNFTNATIRISARPIYPPNPVAFLGTGPIVDTEPVELILFGEVDAMGTPLPGRTLVQGRDYSIDPTTGAVELLAYQQPLKGKQSLYLRSTQKDSLAPYLEDGALIIPRYKAGYAHVVTPTESNGFLNAYLVGTYTFASPDSFYVRAVPMVDYMGEVAQIAIDRVKAQTPHGGPIITSGPPQENWQFGTLPVLSQERELKDQDRAARVFISLYDSFIQTFEQIKETIQGDVVGDRDGKFRFFVGRNKVYGGPGYEDQITGYLQPRFVWSQVFEAANGSFGVAPSDPIVNPETASKNYSTLAVTGDPMNPWLLDFYIKEQRKVVLNDMDDVVLVGKDRAKLVFPFSFKILGDFKKMWEPSVISRLYPEYTLAFTTTYPGLLAGTLPTDPGVYSFLKLIQKPKLLKGEGPVFGSTYQQDIGDVSNPTLGLIKNITGQVHPRERLARARIWAYSPTGFPDLDSGTTGKPAVIATPLLLREFPIDASTGLPDLTRLASNGGDLQDLSTGDLDLSTPAWSSYDDATGVIPQVAFGRPSGDTYSVGYASGTIDNAFSGAFTFKEPIFKGIYVGGVYSGCILTFTSGDGSEITSADDIIQIAEDGTLPFGPVLGDTIYVIPPASMDASAFSNPPSVADLKKFARHQPSLDVGVRERRSAFVDRSLPSAEDPAFPIKEIVNQRTANPLTPIEADVEFVNTCSEPVSFPALLGQTTNDYGDHTVPYLSIANTELERLGAVQSAFTTIVQTDGPTLTHTWLSVYPDEILGNDGTIYAASVGTNPTAALVTSQVMDPVAQHGSYVPHSGIGDVRSYDLLFIETYQTTIPTGIQGILSVGNVGTNTVEPPRFVTETTPGSLLRYSFTNAMTHLTTSGTTGVVLTDTGVITTLNISTVTGLVFNDGSGSLGTVGGLNDIVSNGLVAYPNNNVISIQIINSGTGLVLETIRIQGSNVTGSLGTVAMAGVPTMSATTMTINATGFSSLASLVGAGPFDFLLSIDTFVTTMTVSTGSDTAYVGSDRLSFYDSWDMRTVLARGTETIGFVNAQGELSVHEVTVSGSTTCDVNAPTSVNGGIAFTFLPRYSTSPLAIGFFNAGLGNIQVMGFEGFGNVPLPSTGPFTFSAVPSSDQNETGAILSGTADVADGTNCIEAVVVTDGDLANVVPGDVLVITGPAVTSGSYIVRHAVPDEGSGYTEVYPVTPAGSLGWVESPFPTVVTSTLSPFRVEVSQIRTVALSPSTYDFPSVGRLWVFPTPSDLSTALSVEYTSFTGETFTLVPGSVLDATGTPGPTDAQFIVAAQAGVLVSGATYLPLGQMPSPMPTNNIVGYDHGGATVGGFEQITFTGLGGSYSFASGVDLVDSVATPLAPSQLGMAVSDAVLTEDSRSFVTDVKTPVFQGVALYVDLSSLADPTEISNLAVWSAIHGAGASGVCCLAPWMILHASDGSATPGTGFLGKAGIFIEPSMPRPVTNLGNGEAKIVDDAHTVSSIDSIGMRSPSSFGVTSPESVSFAVRRIRRFHDVLDGIGDNLWPLRYAYEIRTGVVASYSGNVLVTVGGTQLGWFTSSDVNVNPGDVVRLTMGGVVLEEAEIAAILTDDTLLLRSPGFVTPLVGGETFDIWLRQAPVPHLQSNERLLELITDQTIFTRVADPTTNIGGEVVVFNQMQDTDVPDWSLLTPTPQVGDIVLIDSAGALSGPTGVPTPAEFGSRPFGDQSVSSRVDGTHIAGGPSDLDDNRGWYRVTLDPSQTETYLAVSGVTTFTGSAGDPVLFGSTTPTNQQFAVLPEITDSILTGGDEGQMDLRPTKTANPSTNSYQDGSYKSIGPFSYRIIRPTNLVSAETIDLVLLLRERMLSWVEEMRVAMLGQKQGSYYIFQLQEHDSDLGDSTIGDDGLGVPSNLFISGLSGLTQYAPFANVSDCLSVLDRRYWCLDTRLDQEFPPSDVAGDPYASFEEDQSMSGYTVGSGRPVEPDLIDDVLDRTDQLRSLRLAWIKFRSNQVNGTLPSIQRFLAELPKMIQEQEDLLRLQQSLGGV